jgi:hypothetical protein
MRSDNGCDIQVSQIHQGYLSAHFNLRYSRRDTWRFRYLMRKCDDIIPLVSDTFLLALVRAGRIMLSGPGRFVGA